MSAVYETSLSIEQSLRDGQQPTQAALDRLSEQVKCMISEAERVVAANSDPTN